MLISQKSLEKIKSLTDANKQTLAIMALASALGATKELVLLAAINIINEDTGYMFHDLGLLRTSIYGRLMAKYSHRIENLDAIEYAFN